MVDHGTRIRPAQAKMAMYMEETVNLELRSWRRCKHILPEMCQKTMKHQWMRLSFSDENSSVKTKYCRDIALEGESARK